MSHPDPVWRVAVIYRCCVRYNKDQEWCLDQLTQLQSHSAEGKVITNTSISYLADIWFRETHNNSHMRMAREGYRESLKS